MHLNAIKELYEEHVIAQGKAGHNFDWYKYNYSLIALKCMRLPTNHIVVSVVIFNCYYTLQSILMWRDFICWLLCCTFLH